MCNECFRVYADGAPVCEVCALELSSGPASRWPFAVAFFGAALALCTAGIRLEGASPSWSLWIVTMLIALAIALVIGLTSPKAGARPEVTITEREAELEASPDWMTRAASPYRARIARVVRRVVPLSGRSTALVMGAAFVVSGVALPLGLRLPPWLELEVVLGAWWLGIFSTLALLLYKNLRLAEDHRLKLAPLTSKLRGWGGGGAEGGSGCGDMGGAGCGDASGCGEGLVIVVVLVVALVAALFLVEIVLPIMFFVFYFFVVNAIGRVARDTHGCAGSLRRSLGWGAIWATPYVAPVALVTWGVHSIIVIRHAPKPAAVVHLP